MGDEWGGWGSQPMGTCWSKTTVTVSSCENFHSHSVLSRNIWEVWQRGVAVLWLNGNYVPTSASGCGGTGVRPVRRTVMSFVGFFGLPRSKVLCYSNSLNERKKISRAIYGVFCHTKALEPHPSVRKPQTSIQIISDSWQFVSLCLY